MDPDEYRVPAGTTAGWVDRKTGQAVPSFQDRIEARPATALIFYTDTESKVPLWLQLAILWCRRTLLRKSLD